LQFEAGKAGVSFSQCVVMRNPCGLWLLLRFASIALLMALLPTAGAQQAAPQPQQQAPKAQPQPRQVIPPKTPNIIFILADDLGYGDLGCYGQKKIKTPNLDKLAAEGMRFTQCYAGSTVCAPSRCALMTGKHTGHAVIRGNGPGALGPADLTVAEVLKKAGYRNGIVGKWGHEGRATTQVFR
jgi:hypothetical protein